MRSTPALVLQKMPMHDLRWEKTAMLNAGLDFALLKNKVSGTLEVYSKTTSDLLSGATRLPVYLDNTII